MTKPAPKPKRGRGRPPLSHDQARTGRIDLRVPPAVLEMAHAKAEKAGKSLTQWVVDLMTRA